MLSTESLTQRGAFSPQELFDRLEKYFSLIQHLGHSESFSKEEKTFTTRTIGTVTVAESSESQNIEIKRENIQLYSALIQNSQWQILKNVLEPHEIKIILNLPRNKNEILTEFHARKLTLRLKRLFQSEKYPLDQTKSFYEAPIPYSFLISPESDESHLIFEGFCQEFKNILFRSHYYPNQTAFIEKNSLSQTHLVRLSSPNS